MKKTCISLLLLVSFSMANAQERQIRLASDIWPPFTDTKNNTAFAIDLVKLALSRSGVSIKNQITEFNEVINDIKTAKIDGSAAMWKSEDREEYLIFSDPYLHNQLILVGKKGSDVNKSSLSELKGNKVGIVGSYAYGSSLENDIGVDWTFGKNDQENLKQLLKEELDYILVDALLVQYLLNSRKDEALLHLEIGKNALIKRSLHFAVRKDLEDAEVIIQQFNNEIIRMIADGSYNRILHLNWIKADIDGDGTVELVLSGNKAGNQPPIDSYSVLLANQSSKSSNQEMKYYIGGTYYQNWDNIPKEYKVPPVKEEDLSKIGLVNFRF